MPPCESNEMKETIIWHNPRCSKSRAALQILEEHGQDPQIIRYLEEPPTAAAITRVVASLGIEPRALMRTKEVVYRELDLAEEEDDERLIQAMAENPILIERPIVIHCGRAVIGRPPEKVRELLEH